MQINWTVSDAKTRLITELVFDAARANSNREPRIFTRNGNQYLITFKSVHQSPALGEVHSVTVWNAEPNKEPEKIASATVDRADY